MFNRLFHFILFFLQSLWLIDYRRTVRPLSVELLILLLAQECASNKQIKVHCVVLRKNSLSEERDLLLSDWFYA